MNDIKMIRKNIMAGKFDPALKTTLEFVLELLGQVKSFELHTDGIFRNVLLDIYTKRLANLTRKAITFGGFSETLEVLHQGELPTMMATIETDKYYISVLLDNDEKIVGSVYVEQEIANKSERGN